MTEISIAAPEHSLRAYLRSPDSEGSCPVWWSSMMHWGKPPTVTAAQQGAAPDRLQIRSSCLLAALSAAGELGRWAAARGLMVK